MTPDPDAPATLRQVADMMMRAIFPISINMKVTEPSTIEAILDLGRRMAVIATAPAVAKDGDGGVLRFSPADNCPSKHQCERLQYCSAYKECRAIGIAQAATSNPGTSPSDPLAPMVSAYLGIMENFTESGEPFGKILRRALAAAIESAPFTIGMSNARGLTVTGMYKDQWDAMASALAAELRGGK